MEYEKINFHELRKYAREIGVKAPTTFSKPELIEQIKKVKRGEIEPVFKKSKKITEILFKEEVQNKVENEEQTKIEEEDIFGENREIMLYVIGKIKKMLTEMEEEIKK